MKRQLTLRDWLWVLLAIGLAFVAMTFAGAVALTVLLNLFPTD